MIKKCLIIIPALIYSAIYATPETVTLELTKVDRAIYTGAKGLAVTCNVGGSGDKLFLFDTGSSGLFSGVVGSATNLGTPYLQVYESKISFCGTTYQGSIDFGSGASTSNGIFGGICCAQGSIYTCSCTTSPSCTCASCFPTTDSPGLYGTFGASLVQSKIVPEIYNVIAQLPGNLNTGFIVQTGGYPGISPMLIIGLTDDNRKGFTSAKLDADGMYPNCLNAWNDRSLEASTGVSFGGENQNIQLGTVLFDTGNPDAHISPTGSVNPIFLNAKGDQLATGVLFDAVVNDAVNWSFEAGTRVSEDFLGVTAPDPTKTYMSSGIDIFYRYNVMYDIKNGTIGFQPNSPVDVSNYPNDTVIATPIIDGTTPTSLVQNGPNNVFLTADNTYSNGTIISGGKISIYSDSNLGDVSGGVVLNGGTLRIEDNFSTARSIAVFSGGGTFDAKTFSASLTGALNGKGILKIIGNGVTTFESNLGSFFQGTVEIQGGIFNANGSLESGTVLVDTGGTLNGVGPIGTLINNGIVHPGNSPGIMNVVQTYTQSSTGTLDIDILSTNAFSQLIVGGVASLNGSLDVTMLPGNTITSGDSLEIIQAGAVDGTFAQVNYFNLPASFDPSVIYSPNGVFLLFGSIPYPNVVQEVFTSINENNFRILTRMEQLRGCCKPCSTNFYFGPISNMGDVKSKNSAVGFDYWTIGGLAGFDYSFKGGGIGIVSNFERVYADVDRAWGKFDINQLHASAYATYAICDLALNAIVFGGRDWYSFKRNSSASITKGSPNGYEYGALFGLEYDFPHLTPFATLQYMHVDIDAYSEPTFEIGHQRASSLRTTLGLKVNHTWNVNGWRLTPEINIAWQREFLDKTRAVSLSPLIVSLPAIGRNIGLLGFDFYACYNQTDGLELSYELDYNKLFINNSLSLQFNFGF